MYTKAIVMREHCFHYVLPVTNRCFAMLNCRSISEEESVLVADYDVDCRHDQHKIFEGISFST